MLYTSKMLYVLQVNDIIQVRSICGVNVARSLVFCVVFCRLFFVLLSFFFWPLYYLSSFYGCLETFLIIDFLEDTFLIILSFPHRDLNWNRWVYWCIYSLFSTLGQTNYTKKIIMEVIHVHCHLKRDLRRHLSEWLLVDLQ